MMVFCVDDVPQAGDFLLHHWPRVDCPTRAKARHACLRFMKRQAPPSPST
ncbi:DUF982 domain-containing protein [Pseudaminobacter soli (ex Li et al. 2025)]|uniref:DUF982 domain-containing protein n=1 Tax=Pseudaminobacter soli (ex Li et al. 2025) TaxID=1295366 RepID=A0A2P7SJV5_9HYPH|nr:hypothetical protein C7I85_04000 [Mesorhizobium soli]